MEASKHITRRDFLRLAGIGTAALGYLVYLKSPDGLFTRHIECSSCGAVSNRGHKYEAGDVVGVYCPNCGIEINRLVYDINPRGRFRFNRKVSKRKNRVESWECVQIPFPNARLVQQTDKPAVSMKDLLI